MAETKMYRIIGDSGNGREILRVEGEPVSIKGFGDIELFIHKPLIEFHNSAYSFKYHISEVSTGMKVGSGGATKQEAIWSAVGALKVLGGLKGTEERIANNLLNDVEFDIDFNEVSE